MATFTIFYAWQSNSPAESNVRAIRAGLRAAASRLEEEEAASGLRIVVDEATRGLPGSPNIPQTILAKIDAADAFVGDVTTINPERPESTDACPNPNVTVELGYAIGQLGWGRIVLVFNKAYGRFPHDLPFDIDRQRVAHYELSAEALEQSGGTGKERRKRLDQARAPLFETLYEAVKAIVAHRPPKPGEVGRLSPEQLTRKRDSETIQRSLQTIHTPTLDEFFEEIQSGRIARRVFHFWESFNGTMTSSLFHVTDPVAAKLFRVLHREWHGCVSFGEYFTPHATTNWYTFDTPGDVFSARQKAAFEKLQRHAKRMHRAWAALLDHVRTHFVEIDLRATSAAAWDEYLAFRKEMDARFGRDDGTVRKKKVSRARSAKKTR